MTPGFHPHITAREYFAEPCPRPALTSSTIKALLYRTAAEAAYEHEGITPDSEAVKSTAAKRFGAVAHELALGRGAGYRIGDWDAWQSKEAKAFKAETEELGLVPIKRKEYDQALVTSAIMKRAFERVLTTINGGVLPAYQTEVVFTWQEQTASGPIWCRGMADVWCEELAVAIDPKFTKVLSDGAFAQHAVKMGWDIQNVWYRRGIETVRPDLQGRVRFINTLVSPDPPYVSRAVEADEATTHSLAPLIRDAMEQFGACLKADFWPGYVGEIEPWSARSYTLAERVATAVTEDLE